MKPVDDLEGPYLPGDLEGLKQGQRANAGREGTPVLTVVSWSADADDAAVRGGSSSLIDEIVRDGARRMLAAALEAEVDAYIAQCTPSADEDGRRLVVRNGSHQPREVLTGAGAVEVTAPRVNDKRVDPETGERQRFSSAILPPWCRKSPKVAEVLPLLYLHGLSSGDFVPGAGAVPRHAAPACPRPAITRLTSSGRPRRARSPTGSWPTWTTCTCGPTASTSTSAWSEDKLCLLVMIGVRADGTQGAGRDRRRLPGVDRVVGGPAARLRAPRDARPGARGRRRRAGVLGRAARGVPRDPGAALLVPQDRQRPGRAAQVGAPGARRRRWPRSATPRTATTPAAAAKAFEAAYGAKFPKAVAKITDDLDVLLAFYDYPAEHWIHLRTTNPIESTFATVRHRTKVTKGPGSRAAGLAMAFKLIEAAQDRWRAVNAPHLVALVRAGATFDNGKLVERPDEHTQPEAA